MSDELDSMFRHVSNIMGTHTSEEIISGVWQHTFTPEIEAVLPELEAATGEPRYNLGMAIEQIMNAYSSPDASMFCMTRRMAHRLRVLSAKAQQYVRARKRQRQHTRRHNRACARRKQRGMA